MGSGEGFLGWKVKMYKPSPTDYSKHFDIARTVERASTSGKDTALLCWLASVYWQRNKNKLLGQPNYRRNWWLSGFPLTRAYLRFPGGQASLKSPWSPFCFCRGDKGWALLSSWIKYVMKSPWKAPQSFDPTIGKASSTQQAPYDGEVMFTFEQC